MSGPLWKLDCVHLSGGHRPRLDDVTLEIPAGVTAILGPSGAGKSSLLNLLVGFERPCSGSVLRCFQVPDDRLPLFWCPPADGLWPHLTASEQLRTVLPPEGGSVEELLDQFDLRDKSDSRPDQLSQGESARLAVARAIAADAAVLVLDEPLVHVDPGSVWKYWDALQSSRRTSGAAALVFSTHSADVVIREAEHVICLKAGRLTYAGSVQQLYSAPPTEDVAWSLGPVNWLSPAECDAWSFDRASAGRGYRPEQLCVNSAPDSPLVIQQTRCCGAVTELDLLNERSGVRRWFFERPQGTARKVGDRVSLRWLAALLLCLVFCGCSESAAGPQLSVQSILTWSMPAEKASIPSPRAIHVVSSDELYVLDNAGRVLVFNARGELQRQWWMPDYSVGKPEKIVKLRDGRLAVADTHYHRVVFFDDRGTVLGMFGSLGHEPGQFIYPVAVVEDDSGHLYVCEYGDNDRIQKFDRDGKFVLQFGGQGTAPGEFQRPSGVVWHDGRIYVADAFNNRIQVFSEEGKFLELLGGEAGDLNYPYDIAISPAQELFVVEYGAGRVSKFDLQGRLLGRYGTIGPGEGQFTTPWGLTVDSQARVFVADTGNRRIVELKL